MPGFSLAFAGLFYICSKRASHARLLNTEPFRMTLEDAGLVIGAFLWAGTLSTFSSDPKTALILMLPMC
ncbi:hypothetical protein AW072_27340 [Escherichia coli]|nr:hypothetical protein AW063_27425 [Escherichia coli]OTB94863.1 hypothetical protein AW072_27340 [Escherichia coli]TJQ26262.1 hypothetical protein C9Z64_24500 [Escherichia coli]